MINYVQGDLLAAPAKVLVNTVNTVGAMGKGVALRFKEVFPDMFKEYQRLCELNELTIGRLWLYRTPHKWILNFPTKQHWKNPSKVEYIEAGLRKFTQTYADQGITSIAFPRLGCGNGGLNWESQVQPLMQHYLDRLPIDIFVYSAGAAAALPEHVNAADMRRWLRSEPTYLSFLEVWDDICGIVDSGIELDRWDAADPFRVEIVDKPEAGLLITQKIDPAPPAKPLAHVLAKITDAILSAVPWRVKSLAPNETLVPQEAMLDLWQTIRSYGFCVPSAMPGGLSVVAPYLLPLLAKLAYLQPVKMMTPSAPQGAQTQTGLQFIGASIVAAARGTNGKPESVHAA